jgi:hypothetical protein
VGRRNIAIWVAVSLALMAAGVAVAATVGTSLGTGIAGFLIGVGCVVAVSIVFYEVGRSEDRERAREESERRKGPRR